MCTKTSISIRAPRLLAALLFLPFALPLLSQANGSTTPAVIDEKGPPASNNSPLGPDSQPHPSVAAGKTFTFELVNSRIFPGTTRTITVYVPAAYQGNKAACVY